jgi:hypothetical protein
MMPIGQMMSIIRDLLYRVVHNIVPDVYSIESWLPFIPSQTVPESTPYTFMSTAAAFRQNGCFPR